MNKYLLYTWDGDVCNYAIISVKSILNVHGDGDVVNYELVITDEPQSATMFNDPQTAHDAIATLCSNPSDWHVELLDD